MKKKLAGVLAALMVFTMGTTVSAAPSSSKDSDLAKDAQELVTTVESGSSSVALTASVVATEDLTAVYDVVTEKVGSDTGFQVLAAVEIESATALPDGGVSIKFSVSGLTSGTKNIRIYHKKSSGWEIKTPYVGNGYVSATFDSLSPFFVVKYDSTPSTSDGSEDQSSSVVNNYYTTNTTNNTYNNTDSNNTTTVNNTDSNNTTTVNNTDSNNTTTTTNTDSNNTTTTTNTDSNNSTVTNGKPASDSTAPGTTDPTDKKDTDKGTTNKNTDKKDTTSSDTAKKNTSTTQSATADSTNDNGSKNDNSSNNSSKNSSSNKNDNSSKNTQTVTVNVSGGGSSSAKGGATTSTTSPKTGSSLPALPIIAVFLVMGIAVCGKKARNL
jgi:hypothetical protein